MKEIIKSLIVKIDVIRVFTAFTALSVFAGIAYAMIFIEIPPGNKEILHNLVGIIEGAVMTIITFEFGSSKGNQSKSDKGNMGQDDKSDQAKPTQ